MSNDHLYRIDSDLEVRESVKPGRRVLNFILKVVAVSLVVTVVVYLVIAVAVNTDVEGRLKRENKMFEKLYPELLPQQQLLEDAISNLELKDNEVYEAIFHSSAPSADPKELTANCLHKVAMSYSQQSVAMKYIEVYNEMIAMKRYII